MATAEGTLSDEDIAEHICRHAEWRGLRFDVGQYVGILDGQVVAVAGTAEDADRQLLAIDGDVRRGLLFRVAPPESDIIR